MNTMPEIKSLLVLFFRKEQGFFLVLCKDALRAG
jgi:hypothetical protein